METCTSKTSKCQNILLVYRCESDTPGQTLRSRKLASRSDLEPILSLPSTKTEAYCARLRLRFLPILSQEAFRIELRGISICPWIVEHEPGAFESITFCSSIEGKHQPNVRQY
jgi:hypothetical protein